MAPTVILSIHEAYVTFGGKPLFEDLSFTITEGEKICLVGKNGTGKTTLMQMITGRRELDGGERWQLPNITIGYLEQSFEPKTGQTIFDYIFSGLKPEKQNDLYVYMVEMVTTPFELNPQDTMDKLSGGQLRRAALARALVEEPDILLLDEPTNHLDLAATLWLEEYLKTYRGALLCISHDKTFLNNISQKVFWLDRGKLKICPRGFAHFDEWSEMLLEQEERELRNRARSLAIEEEWASRGVKARRKRNMRRVEDMKRERERLKSDKSMYYRSIKKIELKPLEDPDISSKVVVEFFKVCKTFADHGREKKIFDKFNLRIMRGDRIGILGKNGSGKTTFLKMLLGEVEPDMGKVKLAKNLETSYFDQKRRDLKDNNSLWDTLCPNGGDYVNVFGKQRHVCGYLKDFLFDPKNARDLVGTLSGGQKNRLMLARVLANPGNLLILDEPTNDLDMDTLEMLEDILSQYKGTLLVVSHDRDFLDQTVSQILAFEGNAEVEGYIGGYTDYLESSGKYPGTNIAYKPPVKKNDEKKTKAPALVASSPVSQKAPVLAKKLSFKLQHDWENLPGKITDLEAEIVLLNQTLGDSSLYMRDPETFDKTMRRLGKAKKELETMELRWLEIDEMKSALEG